MGIGTKCKNCKNKGIIWVKQEKKGFVAKCPCDFPIENAGFHPLTVSAINMFLFNYPELLLGEHQHIKYEYENSLIVDTFELIKQLNTVGKELLSIMNIGSLEIKCDDVTVYVPNDKCKSGKNKGRRYMNCEKCKNTGYKWVGNDKDGVVKLCECSSMNRIQLHPLTTKITERSLLDKPCLSGDIFNIDYRPNLLIDKDKLDKQLNQVKKELELISNGAISVKFDTCKKEVKSEDCGNQCDNGLIIKRLSDEFFIIVCKCNRLANRDLHPLTMDVLYSLSRNREIVKRGVAADFEINLRITDTEIKRQADISSQELRDLLDASLVSFVFYDNKTEIMLNYVYDKHIIRDISQEQRNIKKLKNKLLKKHDRLTELEKLAGQTKGRLNAHYRGLIYKCKDDIEALENQLGDLLE